MKHEGIGRIMQLTFQLTISQEYSQIFGIFDSETYLQCVLVNVFLWQFALYNH